MLAQVKLRSPLQLLLNPVIWALAGMVAGVFLFVRGFRYLQRKRLIQDIPFCTVRAAPLGPVEVSGRAVGPYTLVAPLSTVDCYFYRASVWEATDIREKTGWRKIAEEALCVPFFVDDSTGRLLIDPRDGELDLPREFEEEYGASTTIVPDYIRHFLARHGVSTGRPIKLEEHCVKPGDTLFVLGNVQENPGLDPPAAGEAGTQSRVGPAFLSENAADLQRRGVAAPFDLPPVSEVKRPPAAATEQFDLKPPVLLMKGQNKDPFFISWRSQRDVVRELAWRSALYIWGGPALILGGLWVLMMRSGVL